MKSIWLHIIIISSLVWTSSGVVDAQSDSNANQIDSFLNPHVAAELAWLQDIYTHGVRITGDSVYFNDETRRIATDSIYRDIIYPEIYSWKVVSVMLKSKAVKPALWYMINLCQQDTANRALVYKMILPMDPLIQVDRALIAAFYTYIAFDPEVYEIVNGKSVRVKRPDLAEQKLIVTKALVDWVLMQRVQQKSMEK